MMSYKISWKPTVVKLFNLIKSIKKFFFPPHPSISPHLFTKNGWLGLCREPKKRHTDRYGTSDVAIDYLCLIDDISGVEIKPDILIIHCHNMIYPLEIPHTPQIYQVLKEILETHGTTKNCLWHPKRM